ncbi:unnamed protein product [marine sediment metagenome]|uniref:50S ribosomal protein L19 n=2 Tax=marine sediment metagenome TaxID=412755 RepID=X0Z9D7_9ZZZZ
MNKLSKIESKYLKEDIPDFKPGDTVRVNVRIREENKERTQSFEGIVIKRQGSGIGGRYCGLRGLQQGQWFYWYSG